MIKNIYKYYQKYNDVITGFKYAHANYGPIVDNKDNYINFLLACDYLMLGVDNNDNVLFYPKYQCDLDFFNEEELSILKEVKKKLKGKTAHELTNWSHEFKGWKNTKNSEIIDFKYAKYFDLKL